MLPQTLDLYTQTVLLIPRRFVSGIRWGGGLACFCLFVFLFDWDLSKLTTANHQSVSGALDTDAYKIYF